VSGLRFKVGEFAIYAVSIDAKSGPYVGCLCEVFRVGPFHQGERIQLPRLYGWEARSDIDCDYVVEFPDLYAAVHDWQLRKIDPPAEPASLTCDSECEATA